MKDVIVKMLNKQINDEMYSAYLYLAMSVYLESENWSGYAHWMRKQAAEEMEHAERFIKFLQERDVEVELRGISEPKRKWESVLDAFKDSLAHEQSVTASIVKIMDVAVAEKDYASISLLQWFIDEQVEEEDTVRGLVENLKKIDGNMAGLMVLDGKLLQR